MIQRIQSIFLLSASILIGIGVLFPYISFSFNELQIVINAFCIEDAASLIYAPSTPLLSIGITVILAALGNLISIFLFKKRMFQIKIIKYVITLQVLIIAVVAYFSIIIMRKNSDFSLQLGLSSLLLLISIVLNLLAIKNIKKDEDLIRSIDRIR